MSRHITFFCVTLSLPLRAAELPSRAAYAALRQDIAPAGAARLERLF